MTKVTIFWIFPVVIANRILREAIPDFEIASAQHQPRNDSVFNLKHQTPNFKLVFLDT
jgi:hypothetical protein